MRDVITEAVLAEQVGVDCFGVGEHHRADFAISAPEVVLAAIAGRTERIVLGSRSRFSAPTIRFASFSGSRPECGLERARRGHPRAWVVHRVYPLFGYDLSKCDELFEEKLALFAELLKPDPVTWRGSFRSALSNHVMYPPLDRPLAVGRRGRQPGICRRAARYGFPLTLDHRRAPAAIPSVRRSVPQSLERFGKPVLPVAVPRPATWPRRTSRRRTISGPTTRR